MDGERTQMCSEGLVWKLWVSMEEKMLMVAQWKRLIVELVIVSFVG